MEIIVTRWSRTAPPLALYSSAYPGEFEINGCREELTPELVKKIAGLIADAHKEGAYHHAFAFSSRIPYDNLAIVGKKAAFVLLQETHVVGGMSWVEAVYILRKNRSGIRGASYCAGNGSSYSSSATHYRYNVWEADGKIILETKTRKGDSQGPIVEHKTRL